MDTHNCPECDFISKWSSSVNRHFMRKHIEKETDIAPKDTPIAPKDTPNAPKDTPNAPKDTLTIIHENQCEKCEKILSRHSILIKHMKTCKGKVNQLECQYCKEIFSCPPHKYRHQKKCKVKQEEEIKAQTIYNIQTQNNITNNTNNINNTQNINIITYSSDVDECNFIKTEAFTKKIKRLLMRYTNDIKMIKDYNKELFSIKENQCVKKTNLRSTHSKVHVGNNKWITKLDKEVYPQMVSNYTNDLCNLILRENSREKHKALEKKLDYFTDGGYVNDTEEKQKEITNEYYDLVEDLKIFAYDETNKLS